MDQNLSNAQLSDLRRRSLGYVLAGFGVPAFFTGVLLLRLVFFGRGGSMVPFSLHHPAFIVGAILITVGAVFLLAARAAFARPGRHRMQEVGASREDEHVPPAQGSLPPGAPQPAISAATSFSPEALVSGAPEPQSEAAAARSRPPRPLVICAVILSVMVIGGGAGGWADQTQPGHVLFAVTGAAAAFGLLVTFQVAQTLMGLSWKQMWIAGSGLGYVMGVGVFWFAIGPRPATFIGPIFLATATCAAATWRSWMALRLISKFPKL